MGSITADQYFAGVIGLSLLRNWYVDADANEARMAELSTVLRGVTSFPSNSDSTRRSGRCPPATRNGPRCTTGRIH